MHIRRAQDLIDKIRGKKTALDIFRAKVFEKFQSPFFWFKNIYNLKHLDLDKHSYGYINLAYPNEGVLKVGKCCSIADDVVFLLGGQHNYKTISTFPFPVFYSKDINRKVDVKELYKGEDKEKWRREESITVCDDVWIGTKATILTGVTINQGAVVGTCSVVTKDVPPYAIVAGNPARIIKYRFSEEIITELLKFADYSNLNDEKVITNMQKFMFEELTLDNIDEFRKIFTKEDN